VERPLWFEFTRLTTGWAWSKPIQFLTNGNHYEVNGLFRNKVDEFTADGFVVQRDQPCLIVAKETLPPIEPNKTVVTCANGNFIVFKVDEGRSGRCLLLLRKLNDATH
jgi:hypothetical protein